MWYSFISDDILLNMDRLHVEDILATTLMDISAKNKKPPNFSYFSNKTVASHTLGQWSDNT